MALYGTDGFDMYNGIGANTGLAAGWTIDHGTASMVSGRIGGQAVQLATGSQTGIIRAVPDGASFAFGVAVKVSTFAGLTTSNMIGWGKGGYNGFCQSFLYIDTTGVLKAGRGTFYTSSGTQIATASTQCIFANTWHYIEGEVVIHDTTGRVTAWVDGIQVFNATNVDTKAQSTTTVDMLWLQAVINSGGNTQFDDLYFADDATRIGEGFIETLRGNSDASVTWTPNSGVDNYSRINESTVDGDTSYVETGTLNNADLYDFGSLSTTPSNIYGLQVVNFGRKTDAGSRSIALQMKSGSTTSQGPDYGLASSYTRMTRMMTQDPDTSAAWTPSAVNAVQSGPKVTV